MVWAFRRCSACYSTYSGRDTGRFVQLEDDFCMYFRCDDCVISLCNDRYGNETIFPFLNCMKTMLYLLYMNENAKRKVKR